MLYIRKWVSQGKRGHQPNQYKLRELVGVIVTSKYGDKKYVGMVHDILVIGHANHTKQKVKISRLPWRELLKELALRNAEIVEKIGQNAWRCTSS